MEWFIIYTYILVIHLLLMNLNLSYKVMILIVDLCNFYFPFIFLVKQVFYHFFYCSRC